MHLISGDEGWTNVFAQSRSPKYRCQNCSYTIELFDHTAFVCAFIIGLAALLAVIYIDDHLFWLFVELFARPAQAFNEMMRDGPLAVILIPLILALVVLLLVVLPLMGLGYALQSLLLRLQNPRLANHSQKIAPPPTSTVQRAKQSVKTLSQAALIAVVANVILGAGLVTIYGLGGGREEVENIIEGVIPPLFIVGGVMFGIQRWIVGVFVFLLMPVTSLIVHLLK